VLLQNVGHSIMYCKGTPLQCTQLNFQTGNNKTELLTEPRCFQLAKDILSNVKVDKNYLRRWIFSEVMFYVSGRVNCHNYRIWGSENPHNIQEIKRDSAKVNVCFALSCSEVLGPFFFAEETVTVMTYLNMLQLYLLPQLEDHQPNVVFQQDGAPPCWEILSENFLACIFLGTGLGVMDRFHGLRAHLILHCLGPSCGDILRTLFTRPL
jgi:hypothetical protein